MLITDLPWLLGQLIMLLCLTAKVSNNQHNVINPRRAYTARVTVVGFVCLCVCLSVKPHFTTGASVHPEIDVTYSSGNEGQKICGDFSETASLQRFSTPSVVLPYVQTAIFYAHALYLWACAYQLIRTEGLHFIIFVRLYLEIDTPSSFITVVLKLV